MSPAMRTIMWEIGAALDEKRIPPGNRDAIWLPIPTSRLRGEYARDDNTHLKTALERLTGISISGEHKGDAWGAVLLAEWRLEEGGSIAQLMIPPAAVAAIQSPGTFAKIEARALHSLTGHGRQLYVLLSDKKNMRQTHWTFSVDELRAAMNCEDKKAYQVWAQFNKRVLKPALDQINDFGTVSVKMTTQKLGKSVNKVRFDWTWKDPHEAIETAAENERHSTARRKTQSADDAPPMIEEDNQEPALVWWATLSDEGRAYWVEQIGEFMELDMPGGGSQRTKRRVRDIADKAFKQHAGQSST
jgi:hypothetical protein